LSGASASAFSHASSLAVAAAAPQLQPAIEQRDGALARGTFDFG